MEAITYLVFSIICFAGVIFKTEKQSDKQKDFNAIVVAIGCLFAILFAYKAGFLL